MGTQEQIRPISFEDTSMMPKSGLGRFLLMRLGRNTGRLLWTHRTLLLSFMSLSTRELERMLWISVILAPHSH